MMVMAYGKADIGLSNAGSGDISYFIILSYLLGCYDVINTTSQGYSIIIASQPCLTFFLSLVPFWLVSCIYLTEVTEISPSAQELCAHTTAPCRATSTHAEWVKTANK